MHNGRLTKRMRMEEIGRGKKKRGEKKKHTTWLPLGLVMFMRSKKI